MARPREHHRPRDPALAGGKRRPVQRLGDRIFSGAALGAGVIILVLLAGVATFLIVEGWPAITADPSELPGGQSLLSYIGPLAFGSVLAAGLAIIIAVPLSIAVSLFIAFYAPRRIAQFLGYVIDLLAAIPSIVYGLWGIAVLGPATVGLQQWLADHLSWLPVLRGPGVGDRPHHAGGRVRPGPDDPADHLRRHA